MAVNALVLSTSKNLLSNLVESLKAKGINTFTETKDLDSVDYAVIYSEGESPKKDFIKFLNLHKPKTVLVSPFNKSINLALTYPIRTFKIGELISKEVDATRGPANQILNNALSNKHVDLPQQDYDLFTAYQSQVTNEALSKLFGYFTPDNKVRANVVKARVFANNLEAQIPGITIATNPSLNSLESQKPEIEDFTFPQSGELSILVNEMTILENKSQPPSSPSLKLPKAKIKKPSVTLPTVALPTINLPSLNKQKLALAFSGILLLAVMPIILFFSSLALGLFSLHLYENATIEKAKQVLSVSKEISLTSQRLAFGFSKIPGLKLIYSGKSDKVALVSQGFRVGEKVLGLTDSTDELFQVLENDDPKEFVTKVSEFNAELDALYNDLSFLQSGITTANIPFLGEVTKDTLSDFRKYVLDLKNISSELSSLLGYDSPKSYAVFYQDTNELRPTGGFLSAVSILTINNAEIIEVETYNTFDLDSRLPGYVEPPDAIKNYLGEEVWYLRDANWNPDYKITSEKLVWYVDKLLDRQVDGVIAVNSEVLSTILSEMGDLYIVETKDEMTAKNISEKLYISKNRDLPRLVLNTTLSNLRNLEGPELANLTKNLIERLETKDLLVYSTNLKTQEVFKSNNWSGELNFTDCGSSCLSNKISLSEANFGVNKANKNISRTASLSVTYNESTFTNTLEFNIKNNSERSTRIVEDRYKPYISILLPSNASSPEITIIDSKGTRTVSPITEFSPQGLSASFIEDLNPGEEALITYKWSILAKNLKDVTEIQTTFFTQPGVPAYPFEVAFSLPKSLKFQSNPPLSLTQTGELGYNTDLSANLESKIILYK